MFVHYDIAIVHCRCDVIPCSRVLKVDGFSVAGLFTLDESLVNENTILEKTVSFPNAPCVASLTDIMFLWAFR